MKKGLFYLFLCFFALRLEAQHFQVVSQAFFDNTITAAVPAADGGFFAAAYQGNPGWVFSQATLSRYDTAGNELWSINLPGVERTIATDLLPLPDGGIVVCGYTEGCDFGFSGFIGRCDANGVFLWHLMADWGNPLPFDLPYLYALSPGNNGEIYAMAYEGLMAFNLETGLYLESYDWGQGMTFIHYDMHYQPTSGLFFLAGPSGLYSFDPVLNLGVQLLAAPPIGSPYLQILPLNDTVMLTFNKLGTALEFNSGGVVGEHVLGSSPEWMALNGDGRFVSVGGGEVVVYDASFLPLQQFFPYLNGLEAKSVFWLGEKVVLAGEELNTDNPYYKNSNAWLQSYDLDGQTFNNIQEVEMLELQVVQMPVATEHKWGGPFPYTSVSQGIFNVRVRNQSFATLNEVTVNAAYYGDDIPFFCPVASQFTQTFQDLDLGPGEDTLLSLGSIETTSAYSINPWQLCVWTSLPNGQADTDHANNIACVSLLLSVSTTEPEKNSFSIAPNPATDACTITWGENLRPETVQVYDAFGRLLLSERVDSHAGQYVLELGAWPSGVYTVILDKAARRLVKM